MKIGPFAMIIDYPGPISDAVALRGATDRTISSPFDGKSPSRVHLFRRTVIEFKIDACLSCEEIRERSWEELPAVHGANWERDM